MMREKAMWVTSFVIVVRKLVEINHPQEVVSVVFSCF
jgi:hypothetical protein